MCHKNGGQDCYKPASRWLHLLGGLVWYSFNPCSQILHFHLLSWSDYTDELSKPRAEIDETNSENGTAQKEMHYQSNWGSN